jgi:hypothetical protein
MFFHLQEALALLFQLFDFDAQDKITQEHMFSNLRAKLLYYPFIYKIAYSLIC